MCSRWSRVDLLKNPQLTWLFRSIVQRYSHHHLHDSMSSTLSPLGQLNENLFTSPPSLRRLSTSSIATTISCATNPNSPAPRTPKSEELSSPTGFGKILFGEDDFMGRFDPEDRKSIHESSIAPNLLINTHHMHEHHIHNHHDSHGYHPHEDLLRPHQIEHIDRMLLHQPQPQLTQHSIVRRQDTMAPFIDCSNSYASWGPGTSPGEAAMSALQCVTEGYEGEFDISDEDSQHSSPSPVLSRLSSSRRNQIVSSPPSTPARLRRARVPRRTEVDFPLIVSSSDQAHQCPVCRRRFRRPEHLRRHELTHTLERPYECGECGRRFSRTDNLRSHIKTHMKPGGRNRFIPELKMPWINRKDFY